jgi:hypothetical protein
MRHRSDAMIVNFQQQRAAQPTLRRSKGELDERHDAGHMAAAPTAQLRSVLMLAYPISEVCTLSDIANTQEACTTAGTQHCEIILLPCALV